MQMYICKSTYAKVNLQKSICKSQFSNVNLQKLICKNQYVSVNTPRSIDTCNMQNQTRSQASLRSASRILSEPILSNRVDVFGKIKDPPTDMSTTDLSTPDLTSTKIPTTEFGRTPQPHRICIYKFIYIKKCSCIKKQVCRLYQKMLVYLKNAFVSKNCSCI